MMSQFEFKMKVLRFVKKHKKNTNRNALLGALFCLTILLMYPIPDMVLHKEIDRGPLYSDKKFVASFVGDLVFNKYYDASARLGRSENITRNLYPFLKESEYLTGNVRGSATSSESQLIEEFGFTTINIDYHNDGNPGTYQIDGSFYARMSSKELEKPRILYQQLKNEVIATVGVTEGDYVEQLPLIEEANKNAGLVVVQISWSSNPRLSISDDQRTIAKALCDSGADIVIGHNPGIIQPMEIYEGKPILYSLGNFLHGDNYAYTYKSILAQYIVDADGVSKTLRIIPLSLAYGYPKAALNLVDGLYRNSVKRIIISGLPKNVKFTEENGMLDIRLD